MAKQDLLKELFGKFLDDKKMTPEEIRQLRALVQDERNRTLLHQLLVALYEQEVQEPVTAESNTQTAFEEVWAKLQTAAGATSPGPAVVYLQPRRQWWKYAAAAMAVLTFAAGAYWLFRDNTTAPIVQQKPHLKTDVQPGGNKAMLTLADGSIIALDKAQNGTLGQQGNAQVVKLANGQLAYKVAGGAPATTSLYNTITTPRGGRFRVILPDGSRVWLNAASSLHYPTAFNGAAREVTLTGEAYFEIEKNAAMPFRVIVNDMQVEVLGTHFNVMAYTDEDAMNTTLLEGSVKVKSEAGSPSAAGGLPQARQKPDGSLHTSDLRPQISMVLKPGQRASLNRSNGILEVQSHVNTEEAIAWKNDLIQFEGKDLHAAMRMIARWYDVEVEYQENIPNAHFRGGISSNVPVSQVLDMMEQTGEIHFEISGRKIIVTH